MGEWSKKIGEYGENVVENFFSVVGWNDMSKGHTLPCLQSTKHLNEKGNPKETPGQPHQNFKPRFRLLERGGVTKQFKSCPCYKA